MLGGELPPAQLLRHGFWGRPTGYPDWCEKNYEITHYVAEFWNTLSSLPIAGVALFGLYQCRAQNLERRFAVCYLAYFLVGLGSTCYHGTLLTWGQTLDELSMIYCALCCMFVHVRGSARTAALLTAYAVCFTFAYFALSGTTYFHAFLVTYIVLVATLVIRSANEARSAEDHASRRLAAVAGVVFGLGFFMFWVPEHLICVRSGDIAPPSWFEPLQFHAWFHFSSAIGPYLWVVYATLDRYKGERGARLVFARGPIPIPYVKRMRDGLKSDVEEDDGRTTTTGDSGRKRR